MSLEMMLLERLKPIFSDLKITLDSKDEEVTILKSKNEAL